jgi:hypothetical protein
LTATGVICLALAAGGFVYALQSGDISILCAALIALPLLGAAASLLTLRRGRQDAAAVTCAAMLVMVLLILSCAAPSVAQRESVRDLLQLADARGYANAPVLAQRSDDRSAQFYAHDRVVYNAEGEVVTFDEVSLDEARALGEKIVVLIPEEYMEEFRGASGIEILGHNGRMAILGWKTSGNTSEDYDQKSR